MEADTQRMRRGKPYVLTTARHIAAAMQLCRLFDGTDDWLALTNSGVN